GGHRRRSLRSMTSAAAAATSASSRPAIAQPIWASSSISPTGGDSGGGMTNASLRVTPQTVIPAQAGIHGAIGESVKLGPGLRRDDNEKKLQRKLRRRGVWEAADTGPHIE